MKNISNFKRIEYPNGEAYFGEFKNEKREGYGSLTYANGDTYIGYFVRDTPNGNGKYIQKQYRQTHSTEVFDEFLSLRKNNMFKELRVRFKDCFDPLIDKYLNEENPNLIENFFKISEKILNSRDGDFCYRWFNGETLQSIALSANPKLTRERVRQILSKYKGVFKDPSDWEYIRQQIVSQINDDKLPDNRALLQINKRSLSALKRKLNAGEEFCSTSRIKLAKLLDLDVQFEEVNSTGWNETKLIKHLRDFAVFLGKPNLMPMQKDMLEHGRSDLRGIITRFGGQSLVAKKAGLIYQGQLVSEDGTRTFWTDEKIKAFLYEVAEKVGRPQKMPKLYECRLYAPNSGSIISIVTRAFSSKHKTRTWDQVAYDYGFEGDYLVEKKVSASDLLKQAYLETRKK